MNVTGTATATPTSRTFTITVTDGGATTVYTDTWASPGIGGCIEFAGEVRSIVQTRWGIRTEWMIDISTSDVTEMEIYDEAVFAGETEILDEDDSVPDGCMTVEEYESWVSRNS